MKKNKSSTRFQVLPCYTGFTYSLELSEVCKLGSLCVFPPLRGGVYEREALVRVFISGFIVHIKSMLTKCTYSTRRDGSRSAATSKIGLFGKLVNGWILSTKVIKSCILNVARVLERSLCCMEFLYGKDLLFSKSPV